MTALPKSDTGSLVRRAFQLGKAIPGFNIPYLPMMAPVVRALRDTDCFGLIMVARLEWVKFKSGSTQAIRDEYQKVKDERHTRLHLDHVPVIDEDNLRVPFADEIGLAIRQGYQSVMVDGSRLPLDQNIACTRQVVDLAHAQGVPVEAELGAVMGHEAGPLPPYDELFASGKGFTDIAEAKRFVAETKVDWLSVAIGNIHGAISAAARTQKKVQARLHLDHLQRLKDALGVPLVLHGGSGIEKSCILESQRRGIAKINIATNIRQPYEALMDKDLPAAQEAVYQAMLGVIRNDLELVGLRSQLFG